MQDIDTSKWLSETVKHVQFGIQRDKLHYKLTRLSANTSITSENDDLGAKRVEWRLISARSISTVVADYLAPQEYNAHAVKNTAQIIQE